MDDDKRLSYFFLGLGIGVAAGILFAPKSGEETRQLLKSKADESLDQIKRRSEEGREFVSRRAVEFKETAADLVDRSKDVIAQKKEHLSAAVEAGKQAYREATAGDSMG